MGYQKILKNIPFAWKLRWLFKQQPEIKWNLYTYLFPILLQDKQKLIKDSCKATYGLYHKKYLEIFHLTFWRSVLMTRRFGLFSIFRGAYEIKGLPISMEFRNWKAELLLVFNIISPCFKVGCTV